LTLHVLFLSLVADDDAITSTSSGFSIGFEVTPEAIEAAEVGALDLVLA
jgi:hypothetical protein